MESENLDSDLFPGRTPLHGRGDPVAFMTDADGVDSWTPRYEEEQQPYGGTGGGESVDVRPLNAYRVGPSSVAVKLGTVDGVIVSNCDTEIPVSGTYTYLYLNVSVSGPIGGDITSAGISTSSVSTTETSASRTVARIDIIDGIMTINNFLAGSQDHDSCQASHSFILS